MTMPAMGSTPCPLNGTTPDPSTRASTGTAPAARASITHGSDRRGTPIRPCAVTDATTNISPTNANDHHGDRSAAAITSDTTDSCTTAREAAVNWSRSTPSFPAYDAVIATATSRTRTTASRRSGCGVAVAASTTPRNATDA